MELWYLMDYERKKHTVNCLAQSDIKTGSDVLKYFKKEGLRSYSNEGTKISHYIYSSAFT